MLPNSDLSLISTAQPHKVRDASSHDKGADKGFHDVMREANASAEKQKTEPVRKEKIDKEAANTSSHRNHSTDSDNAVASSNSSSRESSKVASESNDAELSNQGEKSGSDQNHKEAQTSSSQADKKIAVSNSQETKGSDTDISISDSELTANVVDITSSIGSDELKDGNNLQSLRPENAILPSLADQSPLTIESDGDGDGDVSDVELTAISAAAAIDPDMINGEIGRKALLPDELSNVSDVNALPSNISASSDIKNDNVKVSGIDLSNLKAESAVDLSKNQSDIELSSDELNSTSNNTTMPVSANASDLVTVADDVIEQSDLSAQLATAALGLNSISKEKSKAAQENGEGATKLTASNSLSKEHDLPLDQPVELDWVLQQMNNVDGQSLESPSVLAKSDATNSKMNTVTAALGLNALDANKVTSLQPLEMGREWVSDNELTNSTLLEADLLGGDLELLAKEQFTTRSNIAESTVGGGLSSVLAQPVDAKMAQLGVVGANGAPTNATTLTMQVPPTHPNWGAEMGDKLTWMTQQGVHKAEIHLDPPELGSLTVKIAIDADSASVSFVVASSQVKDLLDGQVQRLREMLAQQNISLDSVDVDVSRQGAGSSNNENDSAQGQASNSGLDETDGMPDETNMSVNTGHVSPSRVDFYA